MGGTSIQNQVEAELLAKTLLHILDAGLPRNKVAVITAYSAQRTLIRSLIPCGHPASDVRVDTVDGFQGMERDLVLVSTTRCNQSGNLGFLSDPRRANVLLTRARRGLVVFGDWATLSAERHVWRPWLQWVHEHCGVCGSAAELNWW